MPSDDEIRRLIEAPECSAWARVALALALERDPVDAANDAAVVAALLDKRAAEVLAAAVAQGVIWRAAGR